MTHITNPEVLLRLRAINGCALSTTPTLHYSYCLAKSMVENGVAGDFVECGVYAGSQCGAMALALQEQKDGRKIHCFDSFCGFPKATAGDDASWQQRLGVGHSTEPSKALDPKWGFDSQMTVERVKAHFTQWGLPLAMFEFHAGWFENTVPLFKKPIALLRLDGDLYDSTLVCLKHLYPLLAIGGVCILDDYGVEGCRKAFEEYFGKHLPPFAHFENSEPVWWVKHA